jgi:hypothetical protein
MADGSRFSYARLPCRREWLPLSLGLGWPVLSFSRFLVSACYDVQVQQVLVHSNDVHCTGLLSALPGIRPGRIIVVSLPRALFVSQIAYTFL